jgi:predicted dehydrogenase
MEDANALMPDRTRERDAASPSRPLEIGVVGVGYWGPNLVRNLSALADCTVREICDLKPERLEHMRKLYPHVRTSRDPDGLFSDEDIDAVVIATPVRHHYELAHRSLSAGKHTLVEKPIASSSEECRGLMELAEEMGLTLMVGHTFIYSQVVRQIKEIVDSGEIGEILHISARRLNLGLLQTDINVTWDLAPHDLSIILYLMEETPSTVYCQGRSLPGHGVEVLTNMSLRFPSGGFATIQSSWIDPAKVREITIVGDKKMIVYDDTAPHEKVRIYDKRVEVPPHYDSFADFHCSYHYGDMRAPYVKQVEPLRTECEHFVDCIRSGKRPLSGGPEGLAVVQILEAASHSLKSGGQGVSPA